MQEQDNAEVAALADEADMPLEQLLAMYGMVIDEDAQPAQQGSQGAAQAGGASLARDKPSESRLHASKRRRLAAGECGDLSPPFQRHCSPTHVKACRLAC